MTKIQETDYCLDTSSASQLKKCLTKAMGHERDNKQISQVINLHWVPVGSKIVKAIEEGDNELKRHCLGFLLNMTSLNFEYGQIERIDLDCSLLQSLSSQLTSSLTKCLSHEQDWNYQQALKESVSQITPVVFNLALQSDVLLYKAVVELKIIDTLFDAISILDSIDANVTLTTLQIVKASILIAGQELGSARKILKLISQEIRLDDGLNETEDIELIRALIEAFRVFQKVSKSDEINRFLPK